MAISGQDDYWDTAYDTLNQVVDNYAQGHDSRLKYLAAAAQARLGVYYLSLPSMSRMEMLAHAEDAFAEAIRLERSPEAKALSTLWLSRVKVEQQDCVSAERNAQEAQRIFAQIPAQESVAYARFVQGFETAWSTQVEPYLQAQCRSAPEERN